METVLEKEHKIQYKIGDATEIEQKEQMIIIAHICNDIGGWGRGFVTAVSKRWKEPEKEYRKWYQTKQDFSLGEVQFVQVEKNVVVANMVAQHKLVTRGEKKPIRYEALKKTLQKVGEKAKELEAKIYMPKIGTGLAGGEWNIIENIIEETLCKKGIEVIVFEKEIQK